MIDTHCHLDDASFAPDRDAVLARARAAGVQAQIIPAITAASWTAIRTLCAQHADLYPAYGLHPMYLSEHTNDHLEALAHWLEHEQPVAVGECGLDYFVDGLDRSAQAFFFQAQLQLAAEFHLPLIIHARRSVDEVLKMLRHFIRRGQPLSGVVHSFSGSVQQAQQLIDAGFYLSFGGPVTYARAQRLRSLAQSLPLESILLETDAPDQPLANRQGQRNEPSYLSEVLATVAQLRGLSPTALADATSANARRLFSRLPA